MSRPIQRQPLTRERILRAALHVVDRDGLDALSMRRVGEELSVEAMSLYNHVENKRAMLDGVFEAVLSELPPAKRHRSWSAALRERGLALRAVLRAHPNALPLFATRAAVTPAAIADLEAVLALLHDAGFRPEDALRTLQVLLAFVVGHTIATHGTRRPDEESRPDYERFSEETFPRVREMARVLATRDLEREFEFGLDAMLAGIAGRRASVPRGAVVR
ncbi:MAG: TetR/AcrR family transcriptional regulator [Labilithrix sp.]|nr:TetR/AcrR family transcriptional regulator [Labilithrix sp.]MCW5817211.1 TetR/AcrR family transcriptional regulator [Labilithrix sp.]